jgi:hypothetical protein
MYSYVVCVNMLEQRPPVTDYLFEINARIRSLCEGEALLYPVNLEMVLRDTEFCQYLKESNIRYRESE